MKERLNYDKLIIGQSFFMEVIMKKGIIIAITRKEQHLCLEIHRENKCFHL